MTSFSRRIFSSLPRADQRGWAELYLAGLLTVSGKKSLRKLAEGIGMPSAVPSMQQFINQSPWNWDTVADQVGTEVLESLRPDIWVLDTLVVPKRGNHSVGADRYFVPKTQKTVNGQIGVGLFLVSHTASVPVSWRILLSKRWSSDLQLRTRTRIPQDYRIRTAAQAALDLIDATIRRAQLPPRPVVADLRGVRDEDTLIRGLLDRQLEFLLEVDPSARMLGSAPRTAPHPDPNTPLLVSSPVNLPSTWVKPSGLRLLAQSPTMAGEGEPRHWLTNMGGWDARHLARLRLLRGRHESDLDALEARYGACDFEGRSFGGWHRHMTMVSAALAFDRISVVRLRGPERQAPPESDGPAVA